MYRETDREDREVGWDDDMSRYDDYNEGEEDDDIQRLLAEIPPHHIRHLES